ncbi:MAG: 3-phosphoshikimate 1-carboxyvinyltransferase [Sporomusaceae bacterium]|nr:3-phosphoshikimate 1-carboxyvinyltransferase [Sporomusaceae bacterium]
MADLMITPAKLTGSVTVPASKSMSHRALICAGLAQGQSRIRGATVSDDITATIGAMRALGADIIAAGGELTVSGGGVSPTAAVIDCGESGSTLRFLMPLALLGTRRMTFTGRGRLVERPVAAYADICRSQGLLWESGGGLPVSLQGPLQPGAFSLRGDVSSQFLSGLLFALPLLPGDSVIRVTTPLESKGYVDLTLAALADFGIDICQHQYREFRISGGQCYRPRDYTVEGDFSQAAFWLVAGTIGAAVSCRGLLAASLQGDKAIVDLINAAGGSVQAIDNGFTALPAAARGSVIDAADCPDLVPVLAVLASLSQGETRIIRAGRLRIKESDRLAATAAELGKLGADIREEGDSLVIHGREQLNGGAVDSWQDHRIAMALAIASIRCQQPVWLRGAECVSKSYPHFWQDFSALGGIVNERCLG